MEILRTYNIIIPILVIFVTIFFVVFNISNLMKILSICLVLFFTTIFISSKILLLTVVLGIVILCLNYFVPLYSSKSTLFINTFFYFAITLILYFIGLRQLSGYISALVVFNLAVFVVNSLHKNDL